MATFRFKKGLLAEDRFSGFTGIIVYRVDFITGCAQYGLQPVMNDKDNESHTLPKREQFDEPSIIIKGQGILTDKEYKKWLEASKRKGKKEAVEEEPVGGPQRMAQQEKRVITP